MLIDLDQDQPRTYVARGNPKLELIATLGGGIVFLIAIAFMTVALFASPKSSSTQPGIIGGLSVFPIMLISRGLFAMRNITRVIIDKNGIAMESPISFKTISWTQIARIQKKDRSSFMGDSHQTLVLLDAKGKELAQIRDTIDRFLDLTQQTEMRSTTTAGAPPIESEEDLVDVKKARRRAKFVGSLLALLTLFMIAGTVVGLWLLTRERQFARESLPATGTILGHYMNGQTHYVEVEFTDPAGHTHRTLRAMELGPWEELAVAKRAPIVYMRSNPAHFRLAKGEEDLHSSYLWLIFLGASVLFGAGAFFTLLGYDLKTRGGAFQITRWGRALDD